MYFLTSWVLFSLFCFGLQIDKLSIVFIIGVALELYELSRLRVRLLRSFLPPRRLLFSFGALLLLPILNNIYLPQISPLHGFFRMQDVISGAHVALLVDGASRLGVFTAIECDTTRGFLHSESEVKLAEHSRAACEEDTMRSTQDVIMHHFYSVLLGRRSLIDELLSATGRLLLGSSQRCVLLNRIAASVNAIESDLAILLDALVAVGLLHHCDCDRPQDVGLQSTHAVCYRNSLHTSLFLVPHRQFYVGGMGRLANDPQVITSLLRFPELLRQSRAHESSSSSSSNVVELQHSHDHPLQNLWMSYSQQSLIFSAEAAHRVARQLIRRDENICRAASIITIDIGCGSGVFSSVLRREIDLCVAKNLGNEEDRIHSILVDLPFVIK